MSKIEKQENERCNCEYFGVCPECKKPGICLNVGREHWFVCYEHKLTWHVGSNLFSHWKEESEELHKKNTILLEGYTVIEEYHEEEEEEEKEVKLDRD